MQSSLILNLLKFLVLFSNLVLAEPALTDGIELPGCAVSIMVSWNKDITVDILLSTARMHGIRAFGRHMLSN